MATFHKEDRRWHGVVCANCGGELYSSLPRLSSTTNWWHVAEPKCSKAEPSAEDVKAMKAHSTHGYHLTEQQGKAVQEILNRYVGELEQQKQTLIVSFADGDELAYQHNKDIDYITELAKLFD